MRIVYSIDSPSSFQFAILSRFARFRTKGVRISEILLYSTLLCCAHVYIECAYIVCVAGSYNRVITVVWREGSPLPPPPTR